VEAPARRDAGAVAAHADKTSTAKADRAGHPGSTVPATRETVDIKPGDASGAKDLSAAPVATAQRG